VVAFLSIFFASSVECYIHPKLFDTATLEKYSSDIVFIAGGKSYFPTIADITARAKLLKPRQYLFMLCLSHHHQHSYENP
jgi:hypothetical protein